MVNRAKPGQKLFIFSIFSAHISLVYSNFNFEELYDVKYGFEISKEPVLLRESSAIGNTVLLSSKHGQQYQCILPDLRVSEKANEENHMSSNEEIPLLLDPLKKKCLYNNKGWWTYEVCFGKGIYQYHEEANKIVGVKISLGFFNNETDWSQEKGERVRSKPGKSNIDKKFHSQYYVNGSECDLTGKARETQIKIFCEEGSSDLVYRVDEPSSCSYVITVYTSKLCNHWLFKPGSSQSHQPITCSPALSEERYKIYIESIEMKKKAKAEAKAEKLRARKERAEAMEYDDEGGVEEGEDEQVAFARKKKKRSKRSQLWPWEDPGVESEDQMLIDGQIKDDQIDVSRLDVMKGGKKNAAGENMEESLTIRSSKMRRMREERKKVETKSQEQLQNIDDLGEEEEIEDTNQETRNTLSDEETEGADHSDHEKQNENTDKLKETPQESGQLTSEASDDIGKETEKEPDLSAKDWEKKLQESFLKLRNTLDKKLGQLEMKSPDLDHNTNEEPIGAAGEVPDNNVEPKSAEITADKTTDDQDAVSEGVPHDEESLKEEAQKTENAMKQFPFLKSIPGLAKVLNNKLLKEILDTATDSQAEIEKKFNEQRAKMKRNVEEMREKMREIEDAEIKSVVKNKQLTETMDKMKASIDRFEKINTELDVDMQSVKELHSEVLSSLTKEIKPDELLERSIKAGKLFKRIVARRILLEEEAQHISKMSEKIAEREGLNMETDAPKDTGIDAVIDKLKTLVHDLDSREDKPLSTDDAAKAVDSSTSVDVGKENDPNTEAGESGNPRGMSTGVKVRVSRIKKVATDDEEDADVDGEVGEKDLEADELEELKMDRRIKQATKKMEEMVKQQLRDSGVVPSGKIKVKIVTSKEALENLDIDNDKDVKLLSEKEETQFRDMILNLLGGTPEAGKERRRQQDLESNYNLVWNDDKLQEVQREDDDTDGEVEVESF